MAKATRIPIKSVQDFEDVVDDILNEYIESFTEVPGLTRDPEPEDFILLDHEDICWMYTQAGMKLYDSACEKFNKLGKKIFPDEEFSFTASGMIMP